MPSIPKKIVTCICSYKFFTRNQFKPVPCPKCGSLVDVLEKPTETVTTEEIKSSSTENLEVKEIAEEEVEVIEEE